VPKVVSVPCVEWFAGQDDSYQREVLPGHAGERVSLERFGESADHQTRYNEFGITAGHVVTAATASLARARAR
jgi:transketolase